MNEHLQKYVNYISNCGGNPKTHWFDDDWDPIGPTVRIELQQHGLAYEENGEIHLTPEGGALVNKTLNTEGNHGNIR